MISSQKWAQHPTNCVCGRCNTTSGMVLEEEQSVHICENCEEQPAKYRLKLEDLEGNMIDQVALCNDCIVEESWSLFGMKLECD